MKEGRRDPRECHPSGWHVTAGLSLGARPACPSQPPEQPFPWRPSLPGRTPGTGNGARPRLGRPGLAMDTADTAVEKLRVQCLARGATGIQGLAR